MAIAYVTTDALKWGDGTGVPHPAAVADNNFWEVVLRLNALEASPPQPVSITDITSDGAALTITLSDATTRGPFTLPVANFQFAGPWLPLTVFGANSMITVEDFGVFLVLQSHTSGSVFDPDSDLGGNPVYRQIFGTPVVAHYDIAANYIGNLPSGEVKLAQFVAPRAFTLRATLPDSLSYLSVAPTADVTITMRKNITVIGTITHAAGFAAGVFSFLSDVAFAPGDRLHFIGPVGADATAADWSISLVADRG